MQKVLADTGAIWLEKGSRSGLMSSLLGGLLTRAGASPFWMALGLAMVFAAGGLSWIHSHYPAAKRLGAASGA